MSSRTAWWGGIARLVLATLVAATLAAHAQSPDLGSSAQLDVPDVVLVDQDGASQHLVRDLIQGKIAIVSFVFTGCTTICSPVGANLGALDHLLGAQVGTQVSPLSVTLDPFNDTPERLAAWRRQFDDAPGWRVLTGDPARVEQLLHAMREDVPDLTQHDAFLWLGDPRTGRWTRASSLASPETLAALVLRMEAE
jgi:protein SCO1/2